MSDEQRAEIDRNSVQSALDAGPTNEPLLAHMDDWRKSLILDLNHVYNVETNSDGITERVISKIKYPDIENTGGVALSHINLILNLPWNQARAVYLNWRNRYLGLRKKYRGKPDALTILRSLDEVYMSANFGGALDGSHQRYVWHTMGGGREIDIKHTQSEVKK
jgi:hypothetical protein